MYNKETMDGGGKRRDEYKDKYINKHINIYINTYICINK
jgi:hypothetical protein